MDGDDYCVWKSEFGRNAGVVFSQKIIIAIGRMLKDEPPIEDEDDVYEEDDTDESEFLIIDEDAIN